MEQFVGMAWVAFHRGLTGAGASQAKEDLRRHPDTSEGDHVLSHLSNALSAAEDVTEGAVGRNR